MAVIRVFPDEKIQEAIITAATAFESKVKEKIEKYETILKSKALLFPTERRIEQEIMV